MPASLMGSNDFSDYERDPLTGYARKKTTEPTPVQNQYKLYNSAVAKQADDYDRLMGGYQGVLNSITRQPQLATPSPYVPQTYGYRQSNDLTGAIGNLQNLSQTGGYTSNELSDLRARGISPIRAIYANAQRNLDRQRALQGGYSPNYAAASAKMARELSEQIAQQVTNVNAGIAERVAQNRLSVAPQLASVTGSQSDLANRMGLENAGIVNQASQFNTETPLKYGQYNNSLQGQKLDALRGASSLYGTTPALASLYGSQASNLSNQQNQIDQHNQQMGLNYFNRARNPIY